MSVAVASFKPRGSQLWALPVLGLSALLPLVGAVSRVGFAIVLGFCGVIFLTLLVGTRAFGFFLAVYFLGLFSLARTLAVIGVSPVFLPEALFFAAAVSGLAVWWPYLRSNWGFAVCALALLALDLNAIHRGMAAGYPSAVKGAVLGIWPCFAVIFACLLRARPRYWKLAPWLIVPCAVGLALSILLGVSVTASAFGTYLLVPAAFLSRSDSTGRRKLFLSALGLFAFALLTLDAAKRGPTLAILVACVATRLATRTEVKTKGVAALMMILVAVGVGTYTAAPATVSSLPVFGAVAQRLQTSADSNSESGANVAVRLDFWRYAITTVEREHPLTGVGTGHPIAVSYKATDFSRLDIGPHNSFVGYAFYLGIPSALIVVSLFGLAMRRCWRIRRCNDAAPVAFGAIAGLTILVATNVVFETTYIGGPAWLLLGAALSLRADQPAPAMQAPPIPSSATVT